MQSMHRPHRRVLRARLSSLTAFALATAAPLAAAQSTFTWTTNAGGDTSGSWSVPQNWNNGAGPVAEGAGNIADFSKQNITIDSTVTLDGNHTIGTVIFGDTQGGFSPHWILTPGSPATSKLTLSNPLGTPTLDVRLDTTITASLGGTQGLTKVGVGTLTLGAAPGSNTFTGDVVVEGALTLAQDNQIPDASSLVLRNGASATLGGHSETLNNLTVGVPSMFGGSASFTTGSGAALSNVLNINGGLSISSGSTFSIGGGSTVNLKGPLSLPASQGFSDPTGITVAAGATLDLANALNLTGRITGGATVNVHTNISGGGAISTSTVDFGGATRIIDSTYSPNSGISLSVGPIVNGGVIKVGPGDLAIAGSYSGPTIINEGRVTGGMSPNSPVTLGGGRYILVGFDNFNISRVDFGGDHLTLNAGASGIFSQVGNIGLMYGRGTEVHVPDNWVRNPGSSLFIYLGSTNRPDGTVVSSPIAPVVNATPTTPVLGYAWVHDNVGYGFAYVDGAGHVVRYGAASNVGTSANGPVLNLDPATNYNLTVDSNLTLDPASTPTPNSLNLSLGGPTVSRTLNLNGKTLAITSGGLIEQNPAQLDLTIDNGRLGAPNAELFIHKIGSGNFVLGPNLQLGGGTSSIVIDTDTTVQFTGPVVFNGNTSTFSGGVQLGPSTTTVVNVGSVSNNGALVSGPFGTGTLTFHGGALQAGSTPIRLDNPVTLAAPLTVAPGGQKITFGGPVTLAGATTRTVSAGSPIEFAGPIGDGGAGVGLGISGPVVMSATNTYTGPTVIYGTVTFAARQNIGDVTVPGAATFQTSQHFKTLDVTGTATLTAHGAGPLKAISATGLRATGRLDLTDNAIAVRANTAAGQTTGDLLRDLTALIVSARDGGQAGKWTGSGLVSSAAAVDPRTGVGLIVNRNAQGAAAFPTLGGEALTTDDVIARWTFLGDANLDGTVGAGDFNQLAAHFGQNVSQSAQTWGFGDFNLDGIVGAGDFNLLASNFGLALPGFTSNVTAADFAALQAFDATVVPEPSAVALIALACLVPSRRRLRRQQL